jgi:hypothetical protein
MYATAGSKAGSVVGGGGNVGAVVAVAGFGIGAVGPPLVAAHAAPMAMIGRENSSDRIMDGSAT